MGGQRVRQLILPGKGLIGEAYLEKPCELQREKGIVNPC